MPITLTTKRKKILAVLKNTHGTLSAAKIHEQVPDIDLVTIYRNLDLFTKEKLIKQVYLGAEEAQYEFQNEPHHHAVCTNCEKVIHFSAADNKIKQLLKIKDFSVEEIEVVVRGVCVHKH